MKTTTIEMTPVERQVMNNHIRFASIPGSTKRQMVLDRVRGRMIAEKPSSGRKNVRIELTSEELGVLVEALNRCYPMGTYRTKTIFERARNNLRIELANAREEREEE